MSKRKYIEDPSLNIQKTSTNNNNKKIKVFNYNIFINSLISNTNTFKIACHNIISFTNYIKQNQII